MIKKAPDSNSTRSFLLVDLNSYFATILQQENPALRGRPVAIVKDLGRTCIIAASREAKKLGIKTGTNINQARLLAPDLVELKAEFDFYLSTTERLHRIFKDFSPAVNLFSLDEAFIEVTNCRRYLYPDLWQLGRQIQQRIKAELGEFVTANVGIGPNRLLAKLAAELAPTSGIQEITAANQNSVLAQIKLTDLCGLGPRLARRLAGWGIKHPLQLLFYSAADLSTLVGPFWARELLAMARGEETSALRRLDTKFDQLPLSQSVGRSLTTWQPLTDPAAIKAVLYNLTREVVFKTRHQKLAGRRVGLWLAGSGPDQSHLGWGKQLTLSHYADQTADIFASIWQKLWPQFPGNFKPVKFGIVLGQLRLATTVDQLLWPGIQHQARVEKALDELAQRYGLYQVTSGLLLNQSIAQPEVTGFFSDQRYQWQQRAAAN